MSVPSDVRSTECHGYHPQDEAVCQQLITVRLNQVAVKGASSKSVAEQNSHSFLPH